MIIELITIACVGLMAFTGFLLWDQWRVLSVVTLGCAMLLAITIIARNVPVDEPDYIPPTTNR